MGKSSNWEEVVSMAKSKQSTLDFLSQFPWWVSVVLSAVAYIFLKFLIPSLRFENAIFKAVASITPHMAPAVGLVLLVPAPIAAVQSWRKKKLLDAQQSLDTILSLGWKEFEELVAEAYRRQGYAVKENLGAGPDGGVDLVLKKDGNVILVQCKQWRNVKVGVSVIREMYGIMTARHANGVIIITSGLFTQEAKNFAAGKPMDLVEGGQLATLIGTVQHSSEKMPEPQGQSSGGTFCPKCGAEMVQRVAKKGARAGQKFWGCSSFPVCRGTLSYEG
jgi:restriction system protein